MMQSSAAQPLTYPCDKCGTLNTTFVLTMKREPLNTENTRGIETDLWRCMDCGHEWTRAEQRD